MSWRAWRSIVVALAVLTPLVFSLGRAAMIDDTLFLDAAAHIARDPLRPFDFVVNWYGWPEPFWEVFKNPPGIAYWLAAIERLGGAREATLHAAMLPFAIAASLAGVALARRFAGDSPWITALWVASPAFLVSASTLMADVPSLAFSLWSAVLWIRGIDEDRAGLRRLGALLAGVAVVTKYTSLVALATLVVYAILARAPRRLPRVVADLAFAIVVPLAWSLLTLVTLGHVHIVEALTVVGGGVDPDPNWIPHRGIALVTFIAGAGVFPLLAIVPASRTRLIAVLALVVGVGAALATPALWPPEGLRSGSLVAVGVLAAAGAGALLVVIRDAARALATGVDADAVFLGVWVVLHVAFLWLWSWTIAARFLLPLLVALALVLARSLGARPGRPLAPALERAFAATVAVTVLVAIVVLRADGAAGDFHRRVVVSIARQARAEGRRVFFLGAWGFQHYAEQAGMIRVDTRAPQAGAGDIVVQPYYVANNRVPPALDGRLERVGNVAAAMPTLGVHTMNPQAGAGFYSSLYGPLPFFVARLPADGAAIFVVRPR